MNYARFCVFGWVGWLISMTATSLFAQGVVRFANLAPGVNAPFFSAQGTNRLAGSNFVAALYVAAPGQTTTILPVGVPQPFREGTNAGYWEPVNLFVPGFPPGAAIRVQIRFWDRARQPFGDFDEAEAAGADIGVAEIPLLQLNADGSPTPLFGLQSASLIPTLTLTRGAPLTATDPATAASGSQLRRLCSVPVGTNRWFRLVSSVNATAVLNTDGSSIDTVMSAFIGSIIDIERLAEIACNDDRAPDRTSSAITLPISANVFYLICVAGKNGASGPVRLTYTSGLTLTLRRWLPGDEIDLSWPDVGGGYVLESTLEPSQPDRWSMVPNVPLLDGDRWIVPLRASDRNKTFRLRAQP